VPAESVSQRRAAAIAKHHPEKLYARNRGLLGLKREELSKVAETKEGGLPGRASGVKRGGDSEMQRGKRKNPRFGSFMMKGWMYK
jgi:hypothetical protein